MLRILIGCLVLLALSARPTPAQSNDQLQALVNRFWLSPDPAERIAEFANSSVPFDSLYQALRAGPDYEPAEPGLEEFSRTGLGGLTFRYTVLVPEGYDPARRYPLQMFLHGGVRRPAWGPGGSWWGNYQSMRDSTRIAVFPAGWTDAVWWHRSQAENLPAILYQVRGRYNVDENRSYLSGVSDGGTGVWYHAFKAPTPWAAFLPYIGHPAVLNNPRAGTDGQLFLTNLSNKPFFVVSGDNDRLYPTASLAPYIERFREAGATIVFRPQRDGGHDMRWVPAERDNIRAFLDSTIRDPLPDTLSWESATTDRYHRFHWLVIDELGGSRSDADFPAVEAFRLAGPGGRVDLARRGNSVSAATRGVRRFTLLLSPEEFDLSQPVTVVVNGIRAFHGLVQPSRDTMLWWASRDRDRTMLFAAELEITIGAD